MERSLATVAGLAVTGAEPFDELSVVEWRPAGDVQKLFGGRSCRLPWWFDRLGFGASHLIGAVLRRNRVTVAGRAVLHP